MSGPYANGSFFSSAQSLELSSSEDSSSSEEIVTSLRGVAGRFFVASRANPGLTDGVGVGSGADTLLGEGGGGAHVKIVECLFQWFEDVYDIEDCFDTAVRYEQLRIMDFFEPKTMPGDWYKIYSLQESVQHIYALEHILLHYERVTRKQLWLCCALGRLCECIQKTMTIFPNSESRGCRQQTNMRTLSLLIQRMCICTSDSNEGRYSCPRNQRPDGSYAFVWQQFVCHSHLQVCKSCLKLHDELMLQKIKV